MNQNNQQPVEAAIWEAVTRLERQGLNVGEAHVLAAAGYLRALATHPAQPVEADAPVPLDLSELDLWSPIAGSKMEVDNACGQYVRFADVQSLLATHSAEPVGDDVRAALQFIHDTFKRDLDAGYKTRDKEFAVAIAAEALQAPVGGELVASDEHPKGFALVPLRMTTAMQQVVTGEEWQWEDLLAAAQAITERQYNEVAAPAGALVAMAEQVETDMADRLRRIVTNIGEGPIAVQSKLLLQAADECDRFYNGMMNWKANAQAKDRAIIELRESAPTESAAAPAEQTQAARDVLAERRRQVEQEGWTPENDDKYDMGELSLAASCYALAGDGPHWAMPEDWPWHVSWWKPADDRRNLVKAGALILADIERLDRATHQPIPTGEK